MRSSMDGTPLARNEAVKDRHKTHISQGIFFEWGCARCDKRMRRIEARELRRKALK